MAASRLIPFLTLWLLSTPTFSQDVGPVVGHVDSNTAHLLIRRGETEQRFRLQLRPKGGPALPPIDAVARAEHDFVAKFEATGLEPGTRYDYRIVTVEESAESAVTAGATDSASDGSGRGRGSALRGRVEAQASVEIRRSRLRTVGFMSCA